MQKKYHKALVFFIDILGSQNRSNFEELLEINTIFHDELEKNQAMDKSYTLTQRHIYTFSDCSYIIYDFKDGVDEEKKDIKRLFFQALYNTEQLIQKLLKGNFICRGGVAYGDVYYEDGRSLLFGGAINRAYQLESKDAIYPRIVIDDFVAEKVLEYNDEILINEPKILRKSKKQINGEIVLKDNDDKYYLNYLNSIKQGYNYLEGIRLLNNLKQISNSEIDRYKINSNDTNDDRVKKESIIKKYNWLLEYIDNSYPNGDITGILMDNK
ncbi:TPA: hypothetical protein I9092_001885 [Clostridium perfringens]|uniref:hypothetical protein n=1 Tax=Clostridium perfringens TaxID=1502 RepID=UPI001A34304A|nr:hypothetical protein [Clostridium perfringens]MDK0848666.1 hypothetical protein [Clostridium perfringens]MDM0694189.1 hypothetical protein [Clostridium perfringens]MDM0699734.1 hypothetical protein [Clostridium perfringens]MDV5090411.1 hypothetical protein [Clostridium perfringens]MDV5108461.1 hypothetical protein [Clostridium perfringens]